MITERSEQYITADDRMMTTELSSLAALANRRRLQEHEERLRMIRRALIDARRG